MSLFNQKNFSSVLKGLTGSATDMGLVYKYVSGGDGQDVFSVA